MAVGRMVEGEEESMGKPQESLLHQVKNNSIASTQNLMNTFQYFSCHYY